MLKCLKIWQLFVIKFLDAEVGGPGEDGKLCFCKHKYAFKNNNDNVNPIYSINNNNTFK